MLSVEQKIFLVQCYGTGENMYKNDLSKSFLEFIFRYTGYYFFAGQTLQNTKISDRVHALHLSQTQWKRIRKHLDRKADIQAVLDKEERKRKYIYEGNKSMTDTWEDSIEQKQKRKDANKPKTTQEIQMEKVEKFHLMRQEQEKVGKELVRNIRQKMFRRSVVCNPLNTAFLTSEDLHVIDKQRELKEYIKKHEADEEMKLGQKFRQAAQNDAEEKKATSQKEFEKRKEYDEYLRQFIAEKAAHEKNMKENQLRKEHEDNVKSVEEIERIRKYEENLRKTIHKEAKAERAKFNKGQKAFQKQMKMEEQELDEVIELYSDAQHRMNCMKKERHEEIRLEGYNKRELLAKKQRASEVDAEKKKAEAEEQLLRDAIAEQEAIHEARDKAEADAKERSTKMRLEAWQKHLEEKEVQRKKEEELLKWDMLNSYKTETRNKEYDIQKKKDAWDKILRNRQVLLDQMAINEEERAREATFICVQPTMQETDEAFFLYGDEMLQRAKDLGRNTFAIERAIMNYRKTNHLLDEKSCKKVDENTLPKIGKPSRNNSCRCMPKK